jgi:hypothetical protein
MQKHYFKNLTSISNASPAVFTLIDHKLYPCDEIVLATTGALPTGLSIETTYYVIVTGITTSTFRLSTQKTYDGSGTAINTSSAGSGTHSFIKVNDGKFVPFQEDCR